MADPNAFFETETTLFSVGPIYFFNPFEIIIFQKIIMINVFLNFSLFVLLKKVTQSHSLSHILPLDFKNIAADYILIFTD